MSNSSIEGSFQEYWPLIVARQHQRNTDEQLRENTPADGLLAGTATINGDLFEDERDARAIVVHYDYTVLAGTQGGRNHYKQDRMFEMARRFQFPIVFYTEGGGGRPGDDRTGPGVAFDTYTFTQFSKLSGLVPLVGVTNGRCFAGNTALLACCDVIIATEGSTVAMGGPAMIEGGGLGIYTPEEVGPMSFQVPNGVVDILCKDEEEATEVAKQYLSYFQGPVKEWTAPDQRRLRHIVPENRLRLYDMKEIIDTIADEGSVLEIREKFGIGIITAFIRVEGHPIGVIANNPHHLAGAIDSDGSDKGARFLQLCDAFDIPVLSLMDCPGMMVGPDVEATALVRHCARMFNTGANLSVPLFGVVVRKAYGLGVQAMCGASALVGFFTVAWPTAEFAGMNLEGSVKLGYRKELIAIEDPEERIETYENMVNRAYDNAKAVNAAAGGGLDDVIDPAETRTWIANGLKRLPPTPNAEKKAPLHRHLVNRTPRALPFIPLPPCLPAPGLTRGHGAQTSAFDRSANLNLTLHIFWQDRALTPPLYLLLPPPSGDLRTIPFPPPCRGRCRRRRGSRPLAKPTPSANHDISERRTPFPNSCTVNRTNIGHSRERQIHVHHSATTPTRPRVPEAQAAGLRHPRHRHAARCLTGHRPRRPQAPRNQLERRHGQAADDMLLEHLDQLRTRLTALLENDPLDIFHRFIISAGNGSLCTWVDQLSASDLVRIHQARASEITSLFREIRRTINDIHRRGLERQAGLAGAIFDGEPDELADAGTPRCPRP